MKRLSNFLIVALAALTVFSLVGCDLFAEKEPPESINEKLGSPEVSSVGGTVFWERISGASLYEVYRNEELVQTTDKTYYICDDNIQTEQVYVRAVSDDRTEKSEPSNNAAITKQTNFFEEEKLEIHLEDGEYNVAPNINYVLVTGKSSNACIVISDRTTDLFIELDNVSICAPDGRSCIFVEKDYQMCRYGVTIKVNGTNLLNGGDCLKVPQTPADNTQKKGLEGYEGGSGIVLPQINFIGNGNLTLNGGKGGKGGSGAASSGLSPVCYGNGGDGGTGGSGIKTRKLVFAMTTQGVVKVFGGLGGEKGSPGNNGSVISGPLNTSKWAKCFGKEGKNGEGLIGKLVQCSGTFIK